MKAVDVDRAAAAEEEVALGSGDIGADLKRAAVQLDLADHVGGAGGGAERGVAHHFDGWRAGIADDDIAVEIGARHRQDRLASSGAAQIVDGEIGEAGSIADAVTVDTERNQLLAERDGVIVDIQGRDLAADGYDPADRERRRA